MTQAEPPAEPQAEPQAENEPACTVGDTPAIDAVIEGRVRDLGGFSVRRTLPSGLRRSVGPFIFLDHMGPADFAPGQGMDVRPHPHIGLATLTYLLDGEIVHRDSIGNAQPIRPGDVNWMIAGRGVAHSERTPPEVRARGSRTLGMQTWIALPREHERMAPAFEHHPQRTLPLVERPGTTLRVIAGTAYGQTAPTSVLGPTLYVHAQLAAGATLAIDDEHAERAAYVVDGELECDGRVFGPATLVVMKPHVHATICARTPAHVMLLGGAPLDGPRHIWWNFVSSDRDHIEQAKADWRDGRFAKVTGDEHEFVPLPEH
jgi:redox-sensitive bicupin YhaK (pirin superfamily)